MKIIKKIWSDYKRFTYWLNWVIPNLNAILTNRIHLEGKTPKCVQSTLITGRGNVRIGKQCTFGYKLGGFYHFGKVEIQARYRESSVIIGEKLSTNNNVFICAANRIEIGDNTLIGQNVTIMDFEAHGTSPHNRRSIGKVGTIVIGKNVWLGNNVTILKNSEIGDNSIVATGAVVTGKFPENVIIGGIPARIVKKIS